MLAAAAGLAVLFLATAMAAPPRVRADVPVTTDDFSTSPAQNSPVMASDPADARLLALANRVDTPDYSCALQLSGDGGRGWATADPVPQLPPGADKCYAPEVAFDRHGTLFFMFVGLHGAGNVPMGAFLAASRDRGRTFGPPHRILGPNAFGVHMALDAGWGGQGRLHLVWLQGGADPPLGGLPPVPNPILASHSDDGGRTFSPPIPVSDPDRSRVVAPALALGPGHAVHVLYYDLGDDARDYQGLEGPVWDGRWSVVLASSVDGGGRFSPGNLVDGAVVPTERVMLVFTMPPPGLAADGAGRLYAAWQDARGGRGDVVLRRSGDGGLTWEPPVRLSDDDPAAARHHYLPKLSVAPGGRLDAVFYDRRRDPEDVRTDVYYTWSGDGGASFAPNLRLNQESFDSRIGTRYRLVSAAGLVEPGSGLALLSGDTTVVAAWADSRNAYGTADAGATGQDVFATEIDRAGGAGTWPLVVLVVVVATAVAVAVALALARAGARRRAGPKV